MTSKPERASSDGVVHDGVVHDGVVHDDSSTAKAPSASSADTAGGAPAGIPQPTSGSSRPHPPNSTSWEKPDAAQLQSAAAPGCYSFLQNRILCGLISNENRSLAFFVKVYKYRQIWHCFNAFTYMMGLAMCVCLGGTLAFPWLHDSHRHMLAWWAFTHFAVAWVFCSGLLVVRVCSWNPFSAQLKNDEIANAQNVFEKKVWFFGLIRFNVRIVDVVEADQASVDKGREVVLVLRGWEE